MASFPTIANRSGSQSRDECSVAIHNCARATGNFRVGAEIMGLDPQDPLAVSFTTNKVGNEPTGKENPELLKLKPSHGHDMTIVNGISRIGYMSGAKAARWKDEDIA